MQLANGSEAATSAELAADTALEAERPRFEWRRRRVWLLGDVRNGFQHFRTRSNSTTLEKFTIFVLWLVLTVNQDSSKCLSSVSCSSSTKVECLKEVNSKVDSLDDLAFFAAGGTPFTRRRDGPIRRDRKSVLLSRSLSCANAGDDFQ